jgi:hypothetical protein
MNPSLASIIEEAAQKEMKLPAADRKRLYRTADKLTDSVYTYSRNENRDLFASADGRRQAPTIVSKRYGRSTSTRSADDRNPALAARGNPMNGNDEFDNKANYFSATKRQIESHASQLYIQVAHLKMDPITRQPLNEDIRAELKEDIVRMLKLEMDILYDEAELEDRAAELRNKSFDLEMNNPSRADARTGIQEASDESVDFENQMDSLQAAHQQHREEKDLVQRHVHDLKSKIQGYIYGNLVDKSEEI